MTRVLRNVLALLTALILIAITATLVLGVETRLLNEQQGGDGDDPRGHLMEAGAGHYARRDDDKRGDLGRAVNVALHAGDIGGCRDRCRSGDEDGGRNRESS